jgi:hypothetical protein
VLWIRIRVYFGRLDPDPGGQKKKKKLKWFELRAEGLSCGLDDFLHVHGGLMINVLQGFIKKKK